MDTKAPGGRTANYPTWLPEPDVTRAQAGAPEHGNYSGGNVPAATPALSFGRLLDAAHNEEDDETTDQSSLNILTCWLTSPPRRAAAFGV
jgi:hypothetical protein